MKSEFDLDAYGVIGLGKFGLSLALELTKAGKDVIVLEIEEEKLDAVKDKLANIYPVTGITQDVLRESGVAHCGTVIVCIGKDLESNILATMNALELKIPRVIAKASSVDHGRVLEKIGAEAIYPEVDMGARLAQSLVATGTLDFLELCDDFSIANISISESFVEQTIEELDLRKKYHLNVIVVLRDDKAISEITPDLVLQTEDILVVGGTNDAIKKFEKANEV